MRINLDVGNYQEANPYPGLDASMPFSPHVVAKIQRLNAKGEEVELDYHKIFAMLTRHHYHGFVTLEYEGQLDERVGVPMAVAMLRRYAKRYDL